MQKIIEINNEVKEIIPIKDPLNKILENFFFNITWIFSHMILERYISKCLITTTVFAEAIETKLIKSLGKGGPTLQMLKTNHSKESDQKANEVFIWMIISILQFFDTIRCLDPICKNTDYYDTHIKSLFSYFIGSIEKFTVDRAENFQEITSVDYYKEKIALINDVQVSKLKTCNIISNCYYYK